jgi:hypothetical protein
MDHRVSPVRPNIVRIESAPRPTPTPTRIRFTDVLARGARGLVRGAELAAQNLPGGPLMAVAVRGGLPPVPSALPGGGALNGAHVPEGPSATAGGAGLTGAGGDGIESSLVQSQELNLYYLQVQEQVNAQNRSFTTLSNVLKAQHDTVKTAIGNIR